MNKARRKEIERAILVIESVQLSLESLVDEEQEAFDNLPESIQGSERGDDMETAISILEDQRSNLDDVLNELGELT